MVAQLESWTWCYVSMEFVDSYHPCSKGSSLLWLSALFKKNNGHYNSNWCQSFPSKVHLAGISSTFNKVFADCRELPWCGSNHQGTSNGCVDGKFVKTVNITDGDSQYNTQGFGGCIPSIRSLECKKLIFRN